MSFLYWFKDRHIPQEMKRITIKDLAKLLNLSASTVSRALSDHPDISEATKKRVKEAAEEFNYTANVHARLFRKQDSRLIALVLPEVNMFFTPNLIKGINKTIRSSNYFLITFLSDDSYEREKEIIQQCLNWAVKGVLISLSNKTNDLSHLEPLAKAKIECVLLDKTLENKHFPSLTIDNVEASFKAVSYLISKGHRKIIGVFGNPGLMISKERMEGYKKALAQANIPIEEAYIISENENDSLDFTLPYQLNKNTDITAIFTMSDELLSKSLFLLSKLDISIPDDISIISISDGAYPYLSNPRISFVKDSGTKMGVTGSKLLLEAINSQNEQLNYHNLIPTTLVELESVKKI